MQTLLQILIPIEDVTAVSKEKTAKIFPNAVGICTKTHRVNDFAMIFSSTFSINRSNH